MPNRITVDGPLGPITEGAPAVFIGELKCDVEKIYPDSQRALVRFSEQISKVVDLDELMPM